MARHKTHIPLKIFLNGRLVGHLRKSAAGAIDFQYDESWLAWEHAMPVSLSLPLREDRYIGKPVIAVFDNLLPDNDAIRRRLAARLKAEGDDAYSLWLLLAGIASVRCNSLRKAWSRGLSGKWKGKRLMTRKLRVF